MTLTVFRRAIRVHQWSKNILVFIPLITSHQIFELSSFLKGVLAFFAFSFCASSVYIINDLIDREADRAHPRKCRRPFASGDLSVKMGFVLIGVFFTMAVVVASMVDLQFLEILVFYFIMTTLYSLYLKKIAMLDVIVLAGLYTLRLLGGTTSVGIDPSPWLLAFSMFFFLSLAFMKRFSEIMMLQLKSGETRVGRGYMGKDLGIVADLGGSSAYISVMVLALYMQSDEVISIYSHPFRLWFICPIILYWISRMWLKVRRGLIDDDPLVYALRDRVSFALGLIVLSLIVYAT